MQLAIPKIMHLHFQVQGDGHPLIILHGFLGSSDNWRAMSKRLAARYTVFAMDLRNHGQSPHSDVMNYPVMAEDLREFVDEHAVAKAFLLGHSMGGKVAMQFATEFSDCVEKLAIVDITPKSYPPSHWPLLTALQNLDTSALKTFADADAALAPAVAESALRQFLLKNLTRDPGGGFRWRIALDSITANYDELIKPVATRNTFDKPACFLRAGRSNFVEEKDLALIRKSFPRAEMRTIANAGHWLHIEAPDEFYRAVTEFLAAP
ncbi:MAG TPA: alpha/beta fold hydrolase [Candidatus Binatia bacterium]